jgi:hypothetical protein
VPPPPAPGGAVWLGVGLAPELGVGECVLEPVALADELAPALADELPPVLADELPPALAEEPAPAVPLVDVPVAVPLAEWLPVGGELVADGEDEDGEHPATATVRMAKTPKPLRANFALSAVPAMVPRTVM